MSGFALWTMAAILFFGIGIGCRRSQEAVGFFTFVKPPVVEDVEHYNNAVSTLWLVAAGVFEILGIPMLFLKQNSPLLIPVIFAVVIGIIIMIAAYWKIEAKYKK